MIKNVLIFSGSALLFSFLCWPLFLSAQGVKTYYKQYSIFTHGEENFICEPYQVRKDDWIYKIFRRKGEISESDFPKFLKIFKQINPKIHNLDAIEPGYQILIPLKRVDGQTYTQETPGIVEVPVLEFSVNPTKMDLNRFVRSHTVQPGDTVSDLLGKDFLNKDGSVSSHGRQAFVLLNPGVKDINRVYKGSQVLIPTPDLLSQPWFAAFLKEGVPPEGVRQIKSQKTVQQDMDPIPPGQMKRLERYSRLIQGTLINQGKLHFPGEVGNTRVLDLSKIPILEGKGGEKTLIMPQGTTADTLEKDLLKSIKAHWKQIKIQEINETMTWADLLFSERQSMADKVGNSDEVIAELISLTSFSYYPKESIQFSIKDIQMETRLGRIDRGKIPGLLINEGTAYGLALEALENKGYEVLTLPSELTMGELTTLIFTKLGYATWKNPSFTTTGTVQTLRGVYVSKDMDKAFIARKKPDPSAIQFLKKENIKLFILAL